MAQLGNSQTKFDRLMHILAIEGVLSDDQVEFVMEGNGEGDGEGRSRTGRTKGDEEGIESDEGGRTGRSRTGPCPET